MTNYTIAFWEANQSTLDAGPNFNIDDTAANIQGALNALNGDSHITQIIISNNFSIVINVAKITSDATALSKLINQDGSAANLTVRDTAAHIGNGFATIGTSSQVNGVVISDNAVVTLTASQVSNNQNVLGELVNANATAAQVALKDTAAHIQADGTLDIVEAHLSTITSIVVSNSAVMTLTASQIANDAGALAIVTNNNSGAVTFKVADTGANIGAHLDALQANAQITTITDTDNSAINLNIAQFTSDAGALAKIVDADASPVSFHVSDTAANISSAFNSLNSNSSVTQIAVTDSATNEVTITASQAGSDSAALGELVQADGTTPAKVKVSDTAANVSSALDALNSNTHVDKIVISPTGALTLTSGQVVGDTTALGEIQGSYTIHVTDTAANVTTNLNGLQTNGHVTQIVISDNAEITVSVAQLTSDAGAISDIQNANASAVHVIVADTANDITSNSSTLNVNSLVNKIVVTDSATNEVTINAAQAGVDTTLLGELFNADGTTPAHVKVQDMASNIASHFDALNGNSHVDRIVVTNSASAEVTITVAQAASDGVALGELLASDGVTHVDAAVSDTAANISSAFSALNGNTNINKIIVSDSATNEVTITAAQAASATTALSELFLANGTTAAHVAVGDTAANISSAFDALNGNAHVNKIIVSDSATNEVTVSVAQAASDSTALSELFAANGTTPAQAAVNDTAANISSSIDALNLNSHINKLVVSDSATNQVTVTVAQAEGDTAALNELFQADGVTVAFAAVNDTAAHISSNFDALNGITTINKIIVSDSATNEVTITVSQLSTDTNALGQLVQANGTSAAEVAIGDTAAHISAVFDALNSNFKVDRIIVSDSATNEVTITVAQLSDTHALNELKQSDGTTFAHVQVSDTAANISAAFDTLNGATNANKIVVTDSATNEVTITAGQAANDTTALNELFAANGTTPAHVAVGDTAANISSAFNALNGNTHVNKIVVSDSASNEVTITVAQAASDTTALSELFASNGVTHAHVKVSDTAANVSSAFDALNGNSHVDKIVVSDSATNQVTVSVAQAASDTTALNELFQANGTAPATVAVSDVAATISSAFDALNVNTNVSKIIVSDSGTNEVTLTASQAASDTNALNELKLADGTTSAHVAVSDTAANISSAFNALNGDSQVNKIIVANSASAEVTITVAQLGSDTTALSELKQADGTTAAHVAISDTATNISAAFDTLNSNTQVDHITITPSAALTLTAGQVATDTVALGEITNSNYSINVSDTAAHVGANLDALQSNGHVGAITISDNAEVTVSVAQLTSDATVINEIANANSSPVHVIVSDTAADIGAAFDALNGKALVNTIVVSDSATNEVTITATQAANDTAALNELFAANGVTPVQVTVSDTATDITSALDALSSNTHVNKIIVSDSATNEVSITVAQLASDANALGELYQANGTTLAFVVVNDTAANISAALDTLESSGRMNKIVVSDSASHEVVASVAQLTSDAGVLANLYNANGTTPASVTVSDTAVNISADLNALNSDTQVNHIIISDNGAITVTVAQATSDSAAIGELQNQNGNPVSLTVQDTAANIAGALDTLNGETNISSIVISDNAALTLTAVQVGTDTGALAKLHNLNSSGVQIDVVDTAAHISANLQALQDNPDVVSIVVSDNAPITVTVAQITSDALVLSELQNANSSPVLLTVDDTATNIRANLASLNQNSEISSIVISNNGVLLLSIAQLTTDAHALSITINANGSPYTVRISDIASNISASLDALNANSHVKTITVTDSGAITLSIAQITSDATALSELLNSNSTAYKLSVHDTAANISAAFNALNANSHVSQIVVSDSATNEVLLTAGQFASDITALSELFKADGTTQAHVNVADTAANVTTAINSLVSSQADKITVTDSATNEVAISVAQITSDAAALAKLFNADGTTPANVQVSDTASDIAGALNALNANTQVNKIVVTDNNNVAVSVAQITSDAVALAEMYKSDGTTRATVAVADTAANITAALDSLSANSQVAKIIVNDSSSHEVVVSVAQITSDATALAELYNASGTTHANVSVNDLAAAVSSHFDALNANSQVNKIVVSDSATNEVTLLAAQIAGDATALAELFQANGTTPANVKVSDTASDISAAFDSLNGSSQVNKIVVTDSSGHEVTISIAQLGADTAALGELVQADGTTPAKVAISDTAANISAVLAQLGSNSHVDHIIISDGQALTLTVSQLVNNTAALGEIVGPYSVIVSDTGAHISANLDALEANPSVVQLIVSDNHDVVVSIAQLSSDASVLSVMMDANGLSPASLRISDTAANIQANLGNLEADTANHNIHVITISDSAAITLSASQFTADSVVLGDLRNANATQVQLSMSDTAAHVQAVLDQIEAYNAANGSSKIASIVISNSAQLTITAEQLHDDASVLSEITNRNGAPVTFKIVDTAANITANLATLESNAAHLSTIQVSDNGAIGVNVAQITADADAIALLKNQNMTAYSLTVTDTAGHVQSSLALLNSDSHVDKIVVSDSATSEVHFTVAQVTHDTNVLGELFNADGSTHASIELVDSAGHIQAMTATQIAALAGEGVNVIDSTNNKLMLAVAQYEALGTVQLTQADAVTLTDTGAHIASMTAQQLAGLSAEGVDRIVTTDHQVTFTADQWSALSVGIDSATTITVNGTSGNDTINASSINAFVLNGGGGADTFTVSTGHDVFVYGAASDSTGPSYDTIIGLDTTRDVFHLNSAVTGINTAVTSGMLESGANFNAELAADIGAAQLGANHAVLFTATTGNLAGHTFLIVDTNGVAGYQAGADLVIDVTGGHHLTGLSTSDFITG